MRRSAPAWICALWLVAAGADEPRPVRPGGGYVPPPFTPVVVRDSSVTVRDRQCDLSGLVPRPAAVLTSAEVLLDGRPLAPPAPTWVLRTPAVAVAERSWKEGGLPVSARQTVEYDGFVTLDLTLGPGSVRSLAITLNYAPAITELYHVPRIAQTWAGRWPERMVFPDDREQPGDSIVGVWGGNETAGLAVYFGTRRDWHGDEPAVVLRRDGRGPGILEVRPISTPTTWDRPTTYRFGFIATPVKDYPAEHLGLYSAVTRRPALSVYASRLVIWNDLSDRYATFVTNDPARDAERRELVAALHRQGKKVLAYTTYMHVEQGAVPLPEDWPLLGDDGRPRAHPIGGGRGDARRVFLAASPGWIDWKLKDLEHALDAYDIDGVYVDTSYLITPMFNPAAGLGWTDATGRHIPDYPVWSMRAMWRRAYELFCRRKGEACIYAHHKGGCPAALAAFTSAFCDGEQYTKVQSIGNLTLDAARAQLAGRTIGVRGFLIDEYFRSADYGTRAQAGWDNPTETAMIAFLNDLLPTGYPGDHPLLEMLALRDDLGLDRAVWTPYHDPRQAWRLDGAPEVAISSYRTGAGDTVLMLGNPARQPGHGRLVGPEADRAGRVAVRIDLFSRLGRRSEETPGYRWEPVDPDRIELGRRTMAVVAFIREPGSRPRFAGQRGFVAPVASIRTVPLPPGAVLVAGFDDPDWQLLYDDGKVYATGDQPVDTAAALRVEPKPQRGSASLLHTFGTPPDWRGYGELSFWVRPTAELPVARFAVRLRVGQDYGPFLARLEPADGALPPGQWTRLRFALGDALRDRVRMVRIYYGRGGTPGRFDLDELVVWPGGARPVGQGTMDQLDEGQVAD